jgi:large subunit ribosomal protein L4
MEATVYNQTGKEVGNLKLPESLFGLPWNEELVRRVAADMLANARIPIAHTKNRGEVSGTGKKPWRQKGTGRARHGSRRSPIWVGGGVAHGPRNERDYSRKINKKEKTKALFTALSKKFKDGEIVFLESPAFKEPKTAEAKRIINAVSKNKGLSSLIRKRNAAFVAFADKNDNLAKSFRNFRNLEIGFVKDLNVADLLSRKFLVFVDGKKSVDILASKTKTSASRK